MKAWRYVYDPAGRLIGTSDARGCGKNLHYDNASRLIAEDYSPCLSTQPIYNAYDPATGDGSEVFNKYDTPEAGEPASDYGNLNFLRGNLVSTRDRGAHTRFKYDGRSRVVGMAKRIVRPGASVASTLAYRYTNHWFRTATVYDEVDRVDSTTTGADVPELLTGYPGELELGSSFVHFNYSARGAVTSIDGSYGVLVHSQRYAADGALEAQHLGDAAQTFATYERDPEGRLSALTVAQQVGVYEPPRVHVAQSFAHDEVGNVTAIADNRTPWEWPSGARPISREMTYDAMYRVKSVAYNHLGDEQISPFAAEEAASDARPLPRVVAAARVGSQSWAYDGLGNVKRADDDALTSFDRGFGIASMGSMTAPTETRRKPNQLVTAEQDAEGANGSIAANYDAAGNMIDLAIERDGTCAAPTGKCAQRFLYEWDEVGQLSRARRWDFIAFTGMPVYPEEPAGAPAVELRYHYSQGHRVLKTAVDPVVPSASTHTVEIFGSLRLNHAQYFGTMPANDYERNASTETVYLQGAGRVAYAPGLPNAGSDLHVFLQVGDHMGSATAVIDKDTGDLVEYATYLAYGATETDYRPAAWQGFREDYRFTGKEEDVEVGLTYFGARYYSPYLARFVSADPLTVHAVGADLNPYAYVAGSVFNATDPTGLCAGSIGKEKCADGTDPERPGGETVIQIGTGGSDDDANVGPWTPTAGRDPAPPPPPPPPSSGTAGKGLFATHLDRIAARVQQTVTNAGHDLLVETAFDWALGPIGSYIGNALGVLEPYTTPHAERNADYLVAKIGIGAVISESVPLAARFGALRAAPPSVATAAEATGAGSGRAIPGLAELPADVAVPIRAADPIPIPRALSPTEMAALTNTTGNIEFSQTFANGQHWLTRADFANPARVQVLPWGPDTVWISHTHPLGWGRGPSVADRAVLQQLGQGASRVVRPDGSSLRFGP